MPPATERRDRVRRQRGGLLAGVAIGACLLTVAGCGRGRAWDLAPVEGTLTQGGRPLAGVEVRFVADPESGTEGLRSSGVTDAEGRYRLRTDAGRDGAVIGTESSVTMRPRARPVGVSNTSIRVPAASRRTPTSAVTPPGPPP